MKQFVTDIAIPPAEHGETAARARVRGASPWGLLRRHQPPAAERLAAPPAPVASAAAPAPAPGTVERRLGRRAEALWASLPAGAGGLPDARGADRLLDPPFGAHALLVGLPPAGAPAGAAPRMLHVGRGLVALAAAAPGSGYPGGPSPLTTRLVALACAAAAGGRVLHLESGDIGDDTGAAAPDGSGSLVWRAIGLPFAASADSGPLAVVIASWRRRLSAAETAALHRELAAAIDWMHSQRPKPKER